MKLKKPMMKCTKEEMHEKKMHHKIAEKKMHHKKAMKHKAK